MLNYSTLYNTNDYSIILKNINKECQTKDITFIDNISKEEYQEFANNHSKSHFLQSYEWGEFCKVTKNQIPHYVGMKNKKGELVAATLLLEKKLPFSLSYMYSPRGFLLNYNDKNLIKIFTNFLKKYMKDNNVIYIKFDPDIKYQDIDNNGNKVLNGNNNYELYNYMLSLGYKHKGFYKLYNGNQPRYTFRINLKEINNKEEIKNKFSSSFIKALKKSDYYDLKLDNQKIPEAFYNLIKNNSSKDGFNPKTEKYYQELTNKMNNNIKYFNIKIRPKDLLVKINKDLKEQEELLKTATKRQGDIRDRITKLTKERELFREFTEEEVVICSLIIIYTKTHAWSFIQGNTELAAKIGAVSKWYYEAITDAFENGYEFFDLFGTVGDPNTDYMNLSKLHAFKQSFGDEYIEFMGEFDLVNNKLLYKTLPILLKIYRNLRNNLF